MPAGPFRQSRKPCPLLLPRLSGAAPNRRLLFFHDTSTPEIHTLSLHDALPISLDPGAGRGARADPGHQLHGRGRSEEHTSELQSLTNLVCRLLLEKEKTKELPGRTRRVMLLASPNARCGRVKEYINCTAALHRA